MAHNTFITRSRFRTRLALRAVITFGAAASMLTLGLAFVGVGQAGASSALAFSAGPGDYASYTENFTAPAVVLGASYSYLGAQATGGTAPYTYVSNWTLPAGLSIDPSTGAITGTDTTDPSATSFLDLITVTDSTNATLNDFFTFETDSGLSAMATAAPTVVDPGQTSYTWNGDVTTGGVGTITYDDANAVLPAGLTFDPTTGTVSGSPTLSATSATATVTATDGLGASVSQSYTFGVDPALSFVSTTDPTTIDPGQANYSWNGDVATGGVGPITYSDANAVLPAGLTFDPTTGTFSGTPSANAVDTQVNVFASDSMGAVIGHTYNFIVGSPFTIGTGTPSTLSDGVGTYSFSGAEASGGSGAVTYSLTGTLPAGLSLDATTGLISQLGAPSTTSTATTETFSVVATDALGATSTGQFTITATPVVVSGGGGGSGTTSTPAAVPVVPLTLVSTQGVVGTPLVLTSSGENGTGAVTYAVTATGTAGCSTLNDALSATSVGTCTVMVTQAADANNALATSAPTLVSFVAPAVPAAVLPVNPHAYKVIGKIVQFKTTSVTIVGIGFFGQPKITSSAKGTRAVVSHDSGSVLKVKVTLPKGQSVGVHTFTIALANGKSCKINYTVVA